MKILLSDWSICLGSGGRFEPLWGDHFDRFFQVVTDTKGNLIKVVGIDYCNVETEIIYKQKTYDLNIEPNAVYKLNKSGKKFINTLNVEFAGVSVTRE